MKHSHLRHFIGVAQLGSFTRASITFDIAQPALSRQIRQLENELGVELFYRTGRGVSLTPEGEILMRRGQSILQQLDDVAAEVRSANRALSGSATIGLPPTVGRTMSVQLASLFKTEHPGVQLRIVEGLSGNVLEWLYSGKIDVGVLFSEPPHKTIIADPVVKEDLVLIAPPALKPPLTHGAIRAKDLKGLPLIVPSPHHSLRINIDRVADQVGIELSISLEVDALFSMIEAVRQGMGCTIASPASVKRDTAEGAVRTWRIIEPALTRTLYVATASQRSGAISVQRIAQIVRQQVLNLKEQGFWQPCTPNMDGYRVGAPETSE